MLGRPEPGRSGAWTVDAGVRELPFLADHRLQGVMVLPGAAIVDMVLDAAATTGSPSPALEQVRLKQVCVLPKSGSRQLRVVLTQDSELTVAVSSGPGVLRTTHAVVRIAGPSRNLVDVADRVRAVRQTSPETPSEDHYSRWGAAGNDYGPAFRTLRRIWSGDGEAVAEVHAPSGQPVRLILLDAAVQLVAAAAGDDERPFVWAGCDRLQVLGELTADGHAYARLRPVGPGAEEVTGDAVLLDSAGQVVLEMTGVRLHRPRGGRTRTVAVAATFNADPLIAELRSKLAALGARVVDDRGDSVAALTGPGALLAHCRAGVNIVLVAPQDMCDPPGRFSVPGVGDIAHLHAYESDYLYDEIFVQRAYLRHGIALHPGDTVFDIGANIGMFTIFVQHVFPGSRVYAFEPAPLPFAALRENVARYCPDSQVFNYGISAEDGVRPFTFYRNSTVFSGFAADPERDAATIRTVVENVLHDQFPATTLDLRPIVSRLLRDRLLADVHPCRTRTLSTVLRETGVEHVDLLKIDTEGSEPEVLLGIGDSDWERIRQVVLEVHGRDEQRQSIVGLLEKRGFEVTVDRQEQLLRGTSLTAVVARRPGDPPARASAAGGTGVGHPSARRAAHLAQSVTALQQATGVPCIVCTPGDNGLVAALAAAPGVVVVTDEAALATTAARLLGLRASPLRD